jgi:hypothetical protein
MIAPSMFSTLPAAWTVCAPAWVARNAVPIAEPPPSDDPNRTTRLFVSPVGVVFERSFAVEPGQRERLAVQRCRAGRDGGVAGAHRPDEPAGAGRLQRRLRHGERACNITRLTSDVDGFQTPTIGVTDASSVAGRVGRVRDRRHAHPGREHGVAVVLLVEAAVELGFARATAPSRTACKGRKRGNPARAAKHR